MQIMGIYTLFPKPNLSKRYHSQFLKPYLLRHMTIERPDKVWGIDITYIHMPKGFTTPRQLRSIIDRYMIHYIHRRPHSSIGDEVPANYYQIRQPLTQVS